MGSIMVWWFTTSLPVTVFKALKKIGFMKKLNWPPDEDLKYWMRHEWSDWAAIELPEIWGEGLNCPGCFSNPTSCITAAVMTISFGLPWWVFPMLWLSYPAAGNLILSKVTTKAKGME